MKQPIRFFSIGLLLASVIIAFVYLLEDSTAKTSNADDMNTDEMIEALEVEGFHVLSSSEYIKLTVEKDSQNNNSEDNEAKNDSKDEINKNNNEKENKDTNNNSSDTNKDKTQDDKTNSNDDDNDKPKDDSNDNKENSNNDDEEVITYTLSVESNMLGPDISQLLEENKIIDDAEAFNRYLELEGYAPYIQLGDHKVSSDMSHAELAEKIANQ